MAELAAAAAVVAWLGWTVLLLPVQIGAVAIGGRFAERMPRIYHQGVCRLFGLEVAPQGQISTSRPTLFVVNHCSYFDIAVLGSLTRASFIANREMRDWPFLGLLARLQRSVFITRRPSSTRVDRARMIDRLEAGDNLILFPEGTTGDGNRLLPFRSAFLSLAETRLATGSLVIQPVTIAYVRQNGMPIGVAGRPGFAWYGDVPIGRHFWRAIRAGRITVAVRFHPAVEAARFADRKALTRHCFEQIGAGLEGALHGRARTDAA